VSEDPRRGIVEVMARLGRETQFHIDERYRHFQITDAVTIAVSLLLVVLSVFNVYYVRVLYKDLNGTVSNMESMYARLRTVDEDMTVITDRFERFDRHMTHMDPITEHISALAAILPGMGDNMDVMAGEMPAIEQEMIAVVQTMGTIEQRLQHMVGGVSVMRHNTQQMAAPMGIMNSFMP
jgi:hypothetical protein